ncbi:MAG: Fe-S cluster assembly protein SufD [Synechococcales cyanobacterium M58_A2018_015]|nr:Fe-S cluster assembly protein SufD [Synechococcales cyanobacterium M58_A2018_015]
MSIQSAAPTDTASLTTAEGRAAYLARLLELAQSAGNPTGWLSALRQQAAAHVQEQSFPTTRDEEWRFTDLSELLQIELVQPEATPPSLDLAGFYLPEAAGSRLVFVDGVYAPELSAVDDGPAHLVVGNLVNLLKTHPDQIDQIQPYLGQQMGSEEVFTALNTSGLTDAAVVLVPKNSAIETPIHLLFVATGQTPALLQPRCLLVAAPNSQLTVVEDYVTLGKGTYFTNSVTEIAVQENAQVTHIRLQRESLAAVHIGKTAVSQARTARYISTAISLGAKLSRHNLEIYQTGEQTETTLNGLTVLRDEQLGDTHSTLALSKPYGTSRQVHKCIVDDRAHAVFNGKVFVPKAAQLTDAGQLSRTLLLSPKARVDTKPQLEIVADNVKCTHGATVGQLETDEIFYLQSRGIDATTARRLLVYAFAYEIISQVPIASLRPILANQVLPAQA